LNKKFIEEFLIDDWEIETEDGYKSICKMYKTIKYDVWEIITDDFCLRCADDHIVICEGFVEKFVKDLKVGIDKVITKNGLQFINKVEKLDLEPESMYDISVDSDNHTLFTNGILSHNTTVITVYILWYILFNKEKTVACLANKEKTAIEILDRIKLAYKNLPLWLQQGIEDDGWNKTTIILSNSSKVIAAGTSLDSISGFTISLLYIDEFAKIPSHVADEFISSTYPVISSGKTSKIIIVSTPFGGMNHFYDFWRRAVDGKSSFYPISIRWNDIPGRDDKWRKKTIADIGEERFKQEYECKFLGSNTTLIDSDVLEDWIVKEPIAFKWTGLFRIYDEPIPGVQYVCGVDSAHGINKDYSVIQVLKLINEYCVEQVAIYQNNTILPSDFAQVVISVAQYYNNAYLMVENNGGVGTTVCDSIWYGYEYEGLINMDSKELGIRAHKGTKSEANVMLREYCEKGWLKVVDQATVYELSRYEEISPNVFKCPRGSHDDCVTSLLWALYFIKTDFYEGKSYNLKKIEKQYKINQDEYDVPVVIFDE
jgi:hypothetical protein